MYVYEQVKSYGSNYSDYSTTTVKRVSHIFDRSITTLSMAVAGMEVLFILQHLLTDTHREKGGDRGIEEKKQRDKSKLIKEETLALMLCRLISCVWLSG